MDYEVLIEKYLKGTLNEKEQEEFDTLRGSDKSFDQEVIFHENLRDVLSAENDPVRTMVEEFESDYSSKSTFKGPWKQLLVAASIFSVLGLAVYFNLTQPISSSDLYEDYFERYPNEVVPMVRGSEESNATKAFGFYEDGQHQEAYAMFEDLYEKEGTSYYLFYMSISLLELQRSEEAIELLNQFAGTDDDRVDRVGWYLAMAYLQTDNKAKAKEILNEIIRADQYNASRAEELLIELD